MQTCDQIVLATVTSIAAAGAAANSPTLACVTRLVAAGTLGGNPLWSEPAPQPLINRALRRLKLLGCLEEHGPLWRPTRLGQAELADSELGRLAATICSYLPLHDRRRLELYRQVRGALQAEIASYCRAGCWPHHQELRELVACRWHEEWWARREDHDQLTAIARNILWAEWPLASR